MATLTEAEATAYRAPVRESPAAMARWCLDNLGQRISAVGLGLSDASLVRRYARAQGPRARSARRAYGSSTASRAWWAGYTERHYAHLAATIRAVNASDVTQRHKPSEPCRTRRVRAIVSTMGRGERGR